MRRFGGLLAILGVRAVAPPLAAQQTTLGPCATPDSVAFRGNSRITDDLLRGDVGITPKRALSAQAVTRAIRNLFATAQFDDVQSSCELVGGRVLLVFSVKERPILSDIKVTGVEKLSASAVRDRIELLVGKPIDPALVARAAARIDSMYQASAYTLARVTVDTSRQEAATTLTFKVQEGNRTAVSGVDVQGNRALSDKAIVSGMSTRPEGFWWWRKGEFDPDKYSTDLAEKIPSLYANKGYIDMQIVRDTLVVDRDRGKA